MSRKGAFQLQKLRKLNITRKGNMEPGKSISTMEKNGLGENCVLLSVETKSVNKEFWNEAQKETNLRVCFLFIVFFFEN